MMREAEEYIPGYAKLFGERDSMKLLANRAYETPRTADCIHILAGGMLA